MYLIFFNTYQSIVFVTQMFYDMLEFLNTVQVRLVNPNREGKKKVYDFVADTFTYIPQLTDNEAGNYWNVRYSCSSSDIFKFELCKPRNQV